MTEAIQEKPPITHHLHAQFLDQVVLFIQFTAELLHQRTFVDISHPIDHLGAEIHTDHTGDRQRLAQFLVQPANTFFDDAFHSCRQHTPI